ncbi:hypothetical protein [Sebaldella sp. S0638]|uniref:hypothetical protein n=1 Tax=Sebaldella sp. S0638 TaxID=2957809 RepID=UPI00209EC350|nr:hypothetical protein [Sebaldella sp. S0638]MCP1226453.1 hypothetical protein [Sebaldella sp. S0638]
MLDSEFDELMEDVEESVKEFNETTDLKDLIARSLDYYEELLEEGEIERLTAILSIFGVAFKNLLMTTFNYNFLNETIKNYDLMNKSNFTNHQKEKLEEMIDFYNENIGKMKIWCGTKNDEKVFCRIIFDEDGNKKMVKIGKTTDGDK